MLESQQPAAIWQHRSVLRRDAARDGLLSPEFLQERPNPLLALGLEDGNGWQQHRTAGLQWPGQPLGSQQEDLMAQMNLLSSLSLANRSEQNQHSQLGVLTQAS